MPAAEFVDTNIWVYAHLDAPDDPRSERAWLFIHRLGRPVISAQVVAEYFNVMRRNGEDEERLHRNIARMLDRCAVQPLDVAAIRRTLVIRGRYGLSIWDSQIATAALEAGCSTLYTKDLQHGQRIESLEIINPLQG
ncbi:PIN domain-containing protein [Candidatus Thiosymbion oneisti]|uniref:PIN domain-containing protein n=1 Tax=Candidatus Thiosymbion oneisti TaxID=589554 RepID=UPI000B7CC78F|nr:PIN domain-containing protein [Candidatus Thiosymbion oneisti]